MKGIDNLESNYNKYFKDIYRYVYSFTNNKENAEDITSEVFSIAYDKLQQNKYIEKGKFKSWLFKISINVINNKFRIKKYEIKNNDLIDTFVDESINYEKMEINREIFNIVKNNIADLDYKTKQIILLKVWEGYKFCEISEIVGEKEQTCKTIYYRGIEKLKKIFSHDKNFSYSILFSYILFYKKDKIFNIKVSYLFKLFKKFIMKDFLKKNLYYILTSIILIGVSGTAGYFINDLLEDTKLEEEERVVNDNALSEDNDLDNDNTSTSIEENTDTQE